MHNKSLAMLVSKVKKEIQDLCLQHPNFYFELHLCEEALPRILNGFGTRHFFCRQGLMPQVEKLLNSDNPRRAWDLANLSHSSQNGFARALSLSRNDLEVVSRLFFWLMLHGSLLNENEIQIALDLCGFCSNDLDLFKHHGRASRFAPSFPNSVSVLQKHWSGLGVKTDDIESAVALAPVSLSSLLQHTYAVTIIESFDQSVQVSIPKNNDELSSMFRQLSQVF